jgi:hypothetical protein
LTYANAMGNLALRARNHGPFLVLSLRQDNHPDPSFSRIGAQAGDTPDRVGRRYRYEMAQHHYEQSSHGD